MYFSINSLVNFCINSYKLSLQIAKNPNISGEIYCALVPHHEAVRLNQIVPDPQGSGLFLIYYLFACERDIINTDKSVFVGE